MRYWASPSPPGPASCKDGPRPAVTALALAVIVAAAILPGIIEFKDPPRADKAYLVDAARVIRDTLPPDVIVCDWERLVGYYSMHPYAQWHGSAGDPQLDKITAIRQAHGNAPVILGKVYVAGSGEKPQSAIGPFQVFRRFTSGKEMYVLYALPEAPFMRPH